MGIISTVSRFVSIKNNHRVIDKTDTVKSFDITEFEYSTEYTTFKAVKLFFPNSIGEEYNAILPKDYLKELFKSCVSKYEIDRRLSDKEIDEKRSLYHDQLLYIIRSLKNIIAPFISIVSTQNKDVKDYIDIEVEQTVVKSNLVVDDECVRCDNSFEEGGEHFPVRGVISYDSFPTIEKHLTKKNLEKKMLSSVEKLMIDLADLSNLSAYLTNSDNSYRQFTADMITKMYGNTTRLFPRSIVNYSAFQFCIQGYPYKTPSKRLYSISNMNRDKVNNKFQIIEIYHKNLEALLSFLVDIDIVIDKYVNLSNKTIGDDTIALKAIYGTCIALLSIYSENKLKEGFIKGDLLFSDINKQCYNYDEEGNITNECPKR